MRFNSRKLPLFWPIFAVPEHRTSARCCTRRGVHTGSIFHPWPGKSETNLGSVYSKAKEIFFKKMWKLVCSEAVESKTCETGDQLFSDTSPNGECSLTYFAKIGRQWQVVIQSEYT